MKFNFRKIASVLASVVMLGSTVGIAAAANYPAPFVSGGASNVAVVYGSSAAFTDYLEAGNLQSNLQYELAKQTATTGTSTGASASGGDSVNLATSARKLYYGDVINAGRISLSASDMPNVLTDGKVTDLSGIQYGYTQIIKPGSAAITFGTSGGDLNDPTLYIDAGNEGALTPGHLYNYTLTFSKNINVSDSTNVQGQKINILGVDYIIGANSDVASTTKSLYLYGAGQSVTLSGTETKTVSISGKEHTVELVGATATNQAKITVDGISKSVTKGSSYSFAGDINVYVKDITYQSYAGGVQNVELIVGANTLLLTDGATVKVGADQISVPGTLVTLSNSGGLLSGITVSVAPSKTVSDDIQIGKSFTDPIFGGLKVQFAGTVPALDDSSRTSIKVDTDNTQAAYVTFTSALAGTAGAQRLQYVYDNDTTATGTAPLLAHKTVASANSKGLIHVLEGEAAKEGDWIVINQGDNGGILNVDSISIETGTTAKVTFTDAITNSPLAPITLTLSNGQLKNTNVNLLGGTGYTVTVPPSTNNTVNISWSAASTLTLFPRIKLAGGGWIAFLTETNVTAYNATTKLILPDGLTTLATTGTNLTVNSSNSASPLTYSNGLVWGTRGAATSAAFIQNVTFASGIACNFNFSVGPAVLVMEPKKWNDASYGGYLCVPLTTAGSKEIAIARTLINSSNSGFSSFGSDTYKAQAVDQFGTLITDEQRTNENGVATISMPQSQMFADVLFTAPTATVTAGSAGSGNVRELGNVIVKDSELSSVASRNLLVVGGSCINTVAAKILGSNTPLCSSAFTTATGVGVNQALVKVVDAATVGGTAGNVAMLVAGYEAADTTKAVKYVTTERPATDIGTVKKLSTSTNVATVVTA